MTLKMTMRRPCAKCPFRCDIEPYLRPGRVRELRSQLLVRGEAYFTCHETTVQSEDEDGEMVDGPNAQHCAGALILLEKSNAPTQLMRIFERLGSYDRSKLEMDSPVFDTFGQMERAMRQPRKPARAATKGDTNATL